MILLLLALGCGLVASIGISQVLNRNPEAEPPVEKEPILVASSNIKVNDPLSEKNLKLEEWPKEKVPPDAMRDLKEVEHQRAGSTILSGEPMRKAKFAEDKRLEEIPRGYRVVGVPVNADGAAGNLLQPGDHVDVLFAVKPQSANGQQQPYVAKTILQNIKVFAVNDQWRAAEGKNKSDESITAKTVSLVLNPDQAEILSLATEMGGHIRLTLRSNDDEAVASTNGTMEDEILHGTKLAQSKEPSGNGILDWLSQQKAPRRGGSRSSSSAVVAGTLQCRIAGRDRLEDRRFYASFGCRRSLDGACRSRQHVKQSSLAGRNRDTQCHAEFSGAQFINCHPSSP